MNTELQMILMRLKSVTAGLPQDLGGEITSSATLPLDGRGDVVTVRRANGRTMDINLTDLVALARFARLPMDQAEAPGAPEPMPIVANPSPAEAARDRGMTRVANTDPEWTSRARTLLREIAPSFQGTGEDMRMRLLERGLKAPHHPNAWGSLIGWARRKSILLGTGIITNTKEKKNHATRREVLRGNL